MKQLPRTPKDAQLIGVELKRKKGYKNTYVRQLVNPSKIIEMLDLLKRSGNPYYQFHDSYESFKERCKVEDSDGYKLLFSDEIEEELDEDSYTGSQVIIDEILDDISDKDEDKNEAELNSELEYIAKDPVRRFQFTYNKSLCMVQKYPEIEVQDVTKCIELAPGEGKTPFEISKEHDWDIKMFPHLHNADGSNGIDEDRNTKLTDQNYFIQRILNYDQRFAKSPSYVYNAVGFIERKQLQRNINIAGTRGKKVIHEEGNITYELDDAYAVLENMKNTPKYWKKLKYEMLAKLENLGAFQIFFTLSCADLRWHENFAAILRDMGLNLTYTVKPNKEGYHFTEI